jgi:hypothetical protein
MFNIRVDDRCKSDGSHHPRVDLEMREKEEEGRGEQEVKGPFGGRGSSAEGERRGLPERVFSQSNKRIQRGADKPIGEVCYALARPVFYLSWYNVKINLGSEKKMKGSTEARRKISPGRRINNAQKIPVSIL